MNEYQNERQVMALEKIASGLFALTEPVKAKVLHLFAALNGHSAENKPVLDFVIVVTIDHADHARIVIAEHDADGKYHEVGFIVYRGDRMMISAEVEK